MSNTITYQFVTVVKKMQYFQLFKAYGAHHERSANLPSPQKKKLATPLTCGNRVCLNFYNNEQSAYNRSATKALIQRFVSNTFTK